MEGPNKGEQLLLTKPWPYGWPFGYSPTCLVVVTYFQQCNPEKDTHQPCLLYSFGCTLWHPVGTDNGTITPLGMAATSGSLTEPISEAQSTMGMISCRHIPSPGTCAPQFSGSNAISICRPWLGGMFPAR